MSTIASQFPKKSYVTNGAEKWQDLVEGRVSATSEKFGGRLAIGFGENRRWYSVAGFTIVPEGDRVLDCDGACGGTGVFRGGGYVENGVYKGFSGPCFRCEGTGKQTPKDRGRNRYYDNHVRRIYA